VERSAVSAKPNSRKLIARRIDSVYLATPELLRAISEMANPSQSQDADTQAAVSPEINALLRLLARQYVRQRLGAAPPSGQNRPGAP